MERYITTEIDKSSEDTPRIQQGHAVLGRVLCGLVENVLLKSD